jgi:hypothetical protein
MSGENDRIEASHSSDLYYIPPSQHLLCASISPERLPIFRIDAVIVLKTDSETFEPPPPPASFLFGFHHAS